MVQYVIRCDESVVFSGVSLSGPYSFVELVHIGSSVRDVLFNGDLKKAIRFGSWSEAASVAAFIIQHINENYEDALEVVKVDL